MVSATSPRAVDASSKPRAGLLAALRRPATASSESSAESENDSFDSDHDSAARKSKSMSPRRVAPHVEPAVLPSEPAEDDESDDGAAYERMKKRLAAAKDVKTKVSAKAPSAEQVVPTVEINTEDEDDMPVKTNSRRQISRRSQTASPRRSPRPDTQSRLSTPGLFVTPNASPAKHQIVSHSQVTSDSDEGRPRRATEFQERVRRIRAERLAKEKEEQIQQEKKQSSNKAIRRRLQQDDGSDSDGENDQRMTQQAKPTRKAGKKAMEAMARDQQRISRNMQLTHQAKTRKRHTMKDLFNRLGFDVPDNVSGDIERLPTPGSSSVAASSDAEANQVHDTPPTSPPRPQAHEKEAHQTVAPAASASADVQIEQDSTLSPKLDRGKGRALEFAHLPPRPWEQHEQSTVVQHAHIDTDKPADVAMIELSDSEDETAQTKNRFPVFDRVPLRKTQESASLLHLRHLAHLTSPKNSRKGPKSISLAEMQMSLAQKAREQAQKEREEKLEELRRRGIYIETEEEREKHQMEIEDMVVQLEKQREEDRKLAKMEKEEARKNGETIDDLPSSDESDDDYVGSADEQAEDGGAEGDDVEEVELELSGSEDEEADHENGLLDSMADEDASEEEPADDVDIEDDDLHAPVRKHTTNRGRKVVVDDEDEDAGANNTTGSPTQTTTQDEAMAAFGFGQANIGMGLTQMFAGTMANLVAESQTAGEDTEQNSLNFLRSLPDTQPPVGFSQTSESVVPNSQLLMSPVKESQTGSETQFSLGISQLMNTSPAFSRTQPEDFPEPTQDAGFSFSRSPAGLKPPPSTMDTVMMAVTESPVKQRKGKLQRGRKEATIGLSDVDENAIEEPAQVELSEEDDIQLPPKPRNAFTKMAKGAKKQKAVDDFNKKTSAAKDAVMEQAEESEDEYAGIGGASDDESGEEDEETKKMIEHGEVDVDERQLAAFYADKAKKDDEKNFNELYKNVMNGGLRRRAAGRNGFDMDDSEDEEETRLRRKREEFQKMSRALLADERIGDIAKDEKKQAFFHTLADFADEGEYDFLDVPTDLSVDATMSQSQEQQDAMEAADQDITIPDSQTDVTNVPSVNPLKRKSPSDSQKENRPPPHLRRTAADDSLYRKPMTLADVQHSVSELLDDPRIMVPDSQYSESESDDEAPAPKVASHKPVVDRLTLSRTSTASDATADAANMAFHASSRTSTGPGFRIPSLIRRATSNLSATSNSRTSSGASTPTETVRRGGTGKSNIHAQAREAERRQLLEKKDSKRKEALKKKLNAGRKAGMRSVLRDLGGGFE